MAQAEQEQQQRALGPLAQCRRAHRGHQHQRVDLEASRAQVLDRLLQREVTAEDVGCDITRGRQPARRSAETFDEPARRQQRTGQRGEDQFRLFAERPAMGVVVVATGLAVLALAVVVVGVVVLALRVVMAGMVVAGVFVQRDRCRGRKRRSGCLRRHPCRSRGRRGGRCGSRRANAHRFRLRQQHALGHHRLVVFDPHRSGCRHIGLQHARHAAQALGGAARGPRMQRRATADHQMCKTFGQFGTCGMHQFAHAGQRQRGRFIVHAKLRRAGLAADDMRLRDAGPARQCIDEAGDATVLRIVHIGQDQRQVQAQRCGFGHRGLVVCCLQESGLETRHLAAPGGAGKAAVRRRVPS